MIGKLTTIVLIVKDMDRSVAFYRDVIGLTLEMHTPYWSSLSAGNILLGLHPESEIQAAVQELKAKGATMQMEPKRQDFGWLAIIDDPDGYPVQLAQTEPWAKASNSA